jgi:hypothetical protein
MAHLCISAFLKEREKKLNLLLIWNRPLKKLNSLKFGCALLKLIVCVSIYLKAVIDNHKDLDSAYQPFYL